MIDVMSLCYYSDKQTLTGRILILNPQHDYMVVLKKIVICYKDVEHPLVTIPNLYKRSLFA